MKKQFISRLMIECQSFIVDAVIASVFVFLLLPFCAKRINEDVRYGSYLTRVQYLGERLNNWSYCKFPQAQANIDYLYDLVEREGISLKALRRQVDITLNRVEKTLLRETSQHKDHEKFHPSRSQVNEISPVRKLAVERAHALLGASYVWGGVSPTGTDCSGLLVQVSKGLNPLPRTSRQQMRASTWIPVSELIPGDALFFSSRNSRHSGVGRVNHCGLYIGNGRFIHASKKHGKVVISKLTDSYYKRIFVSAGRWLA